jgi:hypothetical protein
MNQRSDETGAIIGGVAGASRRLNRQVAKEIIFLNRS